jgi:hypothetical protein
MAVGVMKVRLLSVPAWHLATRAMDERCWGLAGGCQQMDEKRTEALRDWVSIVTGMVRSIAGLQSVDEASDGDFGRSEVEAPAARDDYWCLVC